MKLIRAWQSKLQSVNKSVDEYKAILNEDLTKDMRFYIMNEIQKKEKYKELIEETIRRLET